MNSRKLRKNATRPATADAAATLPGTDPDRASFAMALNAARDQVTHTGAVIDLAGSIGYLVLANLIPSRRLAPALASSSAPCP